jgi:hypothetical protein
VAVIRLELLCEDPRLEGLTNRTRQELNTLHEQMAKVLNDLATMPWPAPAPEKPVGRKGKQ